MNVVRNVASLRFPRRPWIVSSGRFDGVHLGHQAILARLVEVARTESAGTLICNFVDDGVQTLGCLRQRVEQLAATGIDTLCLVRGLSRNLKHVHALAISGAVLGDLPVRAFVVGADDATAFESVSEAHHARIEAVPLVVVEGCPITSETVRARVAAGDLVGVERMLGRTYAVGGRVVHGLHRGRQLGFPTANLRVRRMQLPPNGVYAVRFKIGAHVHDGVANLGLNPTFADVERSLETHVFDFDGDLYGAFVEVHFIAYLRGERKFPGIDALGEQIRVDCAAARRLLS